MRHRLAVLAAAAALAAAVTPAWGQITFGIWKPLAGRPAAPYCTAEEAADLSTAPQGPACWDKDNQELLCSGTSGWVPCNTGTGGGPPAPDDAEYVVGALSGDLSAERLGTDTAEIDWDFGTAGQAKLNLIDDSIEIGRLKTSDTPSDGECLIYEATGDEVAFTTCAGGVTDHGALTGLSDDDHSQYALLAGRSGGQTLSGSSLTAEGFELFANAVDTYPRLTMDWAGGVNPFFTLAVDSSTGGSIQCDASFGCSFHVAAGNVWQFTEVPSSPIAQLDSTGHMAFENYLGLGSSALSTATQSCMWVDTDRLFGDKDCDATKDAGEEYLDEAAGGAPDIDSVTGQGSWDTAATKKTADLTVDGVEVDFESGAAEGYPRLAQSTTPPSGDCDASGEAGRLYFDSDADTDGSVYICRGAAGWKDIDDDGSGGTSITLDLGDDGGDDSTALAEIATVNDDSSAITEPSADKAKINFSRIGNYGEYDPLRAPLSGLDANASDEFRNTVNTGLYTWGNQGTATATAELDALRLHSAASASRDRKVLWYPIPASGDWTVSTAITSGAFDGTPTNVIYGLAFLVTGTIATPTLIEMFVFNDLGTTSVSVAMYNTTSYTATYNNSLGAFTAGAFMDTTQQGFQRCRFTDSSNNLACDWSLGGFGWDGIGTRSALSANPSYVGLFTDQNTANIAHDAYFNFIRLCTSGACLTTPWPIGE